MDPDIFLLNRDVVAQIPENVGSKSIIAIRKIIARAGQGANELWVRKYSPSRF